MRANLARGHAALGLCLLMGSCGSGGASSGTPDGTRALLTPHDVTNLPPGDAQGQSHSGLYILGGAADPSTCSCRVGRCADFPFSNWWLLNLVADNGSVNLARVRGNYYELPCTGGINADGHLWCGSESSGSLFLLDGLISPVDGSLALSLKAVVTEQLVAGHDCDIQQSATFLFGT